MSVEGLYPPHDWRFPVTPNTTRDTSSQTNEIYVNYNYMPHILQTLSEILIILKETRRTEKRAMSRYDDFHCKCGGKYSVIEIDGGLSIRCENYEQHRRENKNASE